MQPICVECTCGQVVDSSQLVDAFGAYKWCLKRIDAHRQRKTHVISHVQGLHMGLKTQSTSVHRVKIDNHEGTSPNVTTNSDCNKEMVAYRGISISI